MQYEEYLKVVKRSRAVLDIVKRNNYGLTLRVLEALVAHKKLITNYMDIKKMEFYNESNIFLLEGEDKLENLGQFLNKPFFPIAEEIIASYSEQAWIWRFLQDDQSKK